MVGRRLKYLSIAVLVCMASWANGAAAGPNLPPAPYKPLPVGTKLEYDSWKCTVAKSDGFETVCNDLRISVGTYGGFVALYDQSIDETMGSVAEGTCDFNTGKGAENFAIHPISIDTKARSSIEKLWPLKIGNSSAIEISTGVGNAQLTMLIKGTEDVQIAGETRSTFIVVQEVNLPKVQIGNSCDLSFRRTIWYEPASRIIVKDKMRWLNGPFAGIGWDYELVKATFPGAPDIAKATPSPKPPVAIPPPLVAKPTAVAAAPTRRSTPPPPVATPAPAARPDPYAGIHFGAYHALVIGNNRYRDLPGLKTAAGDAQAVAAVLREDYGFGVDLLVDATRSDIFKSLASLRSRLTANDNLLIYYAGHGYLDEVAQTGYWLPVDSDRDVQTNWISNSDVTAMLRAIRAKHIMVVADSCYAGTLVRSAGVRLKTMEARASWIARMASKRSRTALVSGGLEPVADSGGGTGRQHSVFARALLTALRDNTGVMDGNALFNAIKRPVVLDADQTPQYSDIRRAGHDGGDFLFVKRR